MANRNTAPESLYGTNRDYLREQERKNEILAEIAGEEYEVPGDIPKGKYVLEKRLLDAAQKENELLEAIADGSGTISGANKLAIDYGTDILSLNKGDTPIENSGVTLPAYGVSFDPTSGGLTLTKNGTALSGQTVTIPNYGSPVAVEDASDMTDHDKIYLYEGTTGATYTNGHFYYWDGEAWADGGEYAAATVQTDKTLLVEDRAADAKATGEAVGELKNALTAQSEQIAYVSNYKTVVLEQKHWRVQSGKITANDSFRMVVFPVEDGKTYIVSIRGTINRGIVGGITADTVDVGTPVTSLDYNPAISYSTTNPEDFVITPTGYKYICITLAYSTSTPFQYNFVATVTERSVDEDFYVNGVETATVDNVFSEDFTDAKTCLQNIQGVKRFPNNLVDPYKCINNQLIVYNTGNLGNDNSYFRTGYIPVTAGTTYKANRGRNHAWFNSSYEYLSGQSGTYVQNGVTAPENAAFIVFNVNKATDGISNPFDLYFTTSANYVGGTFIDELNTAPYYYGKTINWIGDSIVADQDFDEIVSASLGMTENDYGISGSTIALNANGSDGRNALCARYDDMTDDTDIVAVSCGTNDFEYAWCPIGTIDDPDDGTSNNTFYGALKTLCKGLIDKYPQKLIFFTTPIKRAQPFANGAGGTYTDDGDPVTPFSKNKYGKTLGDYADMIIEVCGYYSIPVLDMYRESLLNPAITSQQDMFDENLTHPNDAGRRVMARRICGWLTQLAF